MMTISVQNESFLGRYNPIKTEIKRIRSAVEIWLLSYPRIMRFNISVALESPPSGAVALDQDENSALKHPRIETIYGF